MYDSKSVAMAHLNKGERGFFNSPMKGVPTFDPTQHTTTQSTTTGQSTSVVPKPILRGADRGFFNSPMKGVPTLQPVCSLSNQDPKIFSDMLARTCGCN